MYHRMDEFRLSYQSIDLCMYLSPFHRCLRLTVLSIVSSLLTSRLSRSTHHLSIW